MPDLSSSNRSVLLLPIFMHPKPSPHLFLFSFPFSFFLFFFTNIFIIIYFAFVSLSFPSLTNIYRLPNYRFQEVLAGYKSGMCQGTELHSTFKNLCELRQPTKAFSPNLGLHTFLHKLPRFIIGLVSWQPLAVIFGCSTARFPAQRSHFLGSQALRSSTGQIRLLRTHSRRCGG